MSGNWRNLTNAAPFNAGTMLLLTDGSVLCHDEPNDGTVSATNRWFRLVPDNKGSYRNGTWNTVCDGPNAPLYFACSVLRDGRVFIAGGEFNGTNAQVELLAAEIYDPFVDKWIDIGTPKGWSIIGDAPSVVLPDGRVLIGDIDSNRTAIYDPATNRWVAGPTKEDPRGTEETWVLLPDQTVLAIECDNRPNTEKYIIAANKWIPAGSTPVTLVDATSEEVGAALTLPDGRAFCIGATNNTALYQPPSIASQLGTWAVGPSFPTIQNGKATGAKDAPACLLPNGRVLCVVAPYDPNDPKGDFGSPLYFYEFDPATNKLAQTPSPSNGGGSPYSSRLMLLPTGEVLHTNCSNSVTIYTPDDSPDPAWKPTITSVESALNTGQTYVLQGRQLNGMSQAVMYGDEGAMATNYPLVQITDSKSGDVFYCRTFDHSTMDIHTGAVVHSTNFTVPDNAPPSQYSLCAIANGIASDSITVTVDQKLQGNAKLAIKKMDKSSSRGKKRVAAKSKISLPRLI